MFKIKLEMEDTSIEAISVDGHEYCMLLEDRCTGRSWINKTVTAEAMNAIVSLAILGDDSPFLNVPALYELAENALSGCPAEVRPIP